MTAPSGVPAGPRQSQHRGESAAGRGPGQQARENRKYVRRLLALEQPGFAAALELAVLLAGREIPSSNGNQKSSGQET